MKRQLSFQIDIPNPCSQSWDDITPNGNGRHCDSCRKTVIDFSTWSDTELFNFFTKNTGPVCGRYHESQLRRPIQIPYQPHSKLYRMAIAMGLTLMFINTPELHAQNRAPMATATVGALLIPEKKEKSVDSIVTEIRGVVTDNMKEPLVNVSVLIKQNGVLKGGTVTDFDGNYSVKGLDSGYYDVTVSCLGYKESTHTKVLISALTVLDVTMAVDSKSGMLTGVITLDNRPPLIEKYKHSYIIRPQW